jgi:phosphonoacetaldehyde hydrolase
VQVMYDAFVPKQIACITEYADPIPGVPETVAQFRAMGLKVGSTTGYTRGMMRPLLPVVEERGYRADSVVCPDDVQGGRPAPWMCFQNAMILGVYPMSTLVKIGDTPIDIDEGRNAGMWTIGLTCTGNELGMSEADVEALPPEQLRVRLDAISARFSAAGAHYTAKSLADTVPILAEIGDRLMQGEKP